MATVGRGYRGGRYKGRSAGSRVVLYGLILAVALWLVGPFVWLFVTSVSYQKNLLARPFALIPPEVTMDNYKMILGLIRFHAEGQAAKILPSMLNSVVVAVVVTILNLVIGTTAGYAYARYRFPLKTLSLFALLFTRMLPTVVLVPAYFLMLRALGLSNSLTGLVLAYCSFTLPFTVWIMKAYFETVPAELDKSALVDGCNRLQAYYRVVLPVSGPGLVAGGAFTFMLCWNEFIVAQVLNTKPGTTTLPPVIAGMNGQINIDYSVIAASGFPRALPPGTGGGGHRRRVRAGDERQEARRLLHAVRAGSRERLPRRGHRVLRLHADAAPAARASARPCPGIPLVQLGAHLRVRHQVRRDHHRGQPGRGCHAPGHQPHAYGPSGRGHG